MAASGKGAISANPVQYIFAATCEAIAAALNENTNAKQDMVVILPRKTTIKAIPKLRSQVGKAFEPKQIWSMLFADDAAVVSLSETGLSAMMGVVKK